MTDRIAATAGALRAGAEAVNAANGDITETVARIDREIDELAPAWTGPAAASYAAMTRQWQADVRQLQSTLAGLEDAIRATERDQAATEQAHEQVIAGLRGMMGS
jgi:WXG100 family type VII secretion target